MGYNLFNEEEKTLKKVKSFLDEGSIADEQTVNCMTELIKAYNKLLRGTKKLVRISDKSEDKLSKMSKELAAKNKLLEKQKKELEEAAHLREEVGRITRHDLKNPLQNILAAPQLLLMTLELEDYQKDMLKRVEESGYMMLNMINLSLDLFKMEQGTYNVRQESVNVIKVLQKVVGDQESIWSAKEMTTQVLLDGVNTDEDSSLCIIGEELLCYSLFSNLVRNALDAAPNNTAFTVSVDSQTGKIFLHNMGAIPKDIRDTFFEKYATSGKARGTGLGTYSAKLITEVHGGNIDFETSEEEGTTITLNLPLQT
ncbi:MAG: sensor histidine kinase [Desulfovibrio sp.]